MSHQSVKILHTVLSLQVGGVEKLVVALVKKLDRARFRPAVCALQEGGPLEEELRAAGVEVFVLGKREGVDWRLLRRLARLLRQEGIGLLHTHNSAPLFYGPLAAWRARTPVVVHTQHSKLRPENEKLRRLTRWLSRRVSHFISDAGDVTQDLVAQLGVPPEKVSTIPNGVDLEAFAPLPDRAAVRAELGLPPDGPLVACVGRLVPVKDHPTLLRAWREVRKAVPTAHLLLIGAGPLQRELEGLARDLQVASSVHFLGQRNDVPQLLGLCEAAVLSSRSEGLSVALLEAMAARLPVVATRVGGNPEVVQAGETGLLVPPAEPAALAAALRELLQNPARAREMGAAGRARVEAQFSLERMVQAYQEVYEQCGGR
ncbi:MAG TPA: glycosyltransferase [Armatimonadetes bacterium]|nr:glycosyltransferase [Armatimonadota bacterium]